MVSQFFLRFLFLKADSVARALFSHSIQKDKSFCCLAHRNALAFYFYAAAAAHHVYMIANL